MFTYLSTRIQHAFCLAIDINDLAAESTYLTAQHNNIPVFDVIQDDLFRAFRWREAIDVLLFNPPYVPTESSEVGSHGIEAAWAGGIDGREVIDRVLPQITVRNGTKGATA